MAAPLAQALAGLKENGAVKSFIDADDMTLAMILIKGSEAVIYGGTTVDPDRLKSDRVRSDLTGFWKRIIAF